MVGFEWRHLMELLPVWPRFLEEYDGGSTISCRQLETATKCLTNCALENTETEDRRRVLAEVE